VHRGAGAAVDTAEGLATALEMLARTLTHPDIIGAANERAGTTAVTALTAAGAACARPTRVTS
jgi:hypothetical protein